MPKPSSPASALRLVQVLVLVPALVLGLAQRLVAALVAAVVVGSARCMPGHAARGMPRFKRRSPALRPRCRSSSGLAVGRGGGSTHRPLVPCHRGRRWATQGAVCCRHTAARRHRRRRGECRHPMARGECRGCRGCCQARLGRLWQLPLLPLLPRLVGRPMLAACTCGRWQRGWVRQRAPARMLGMPVVAVPPPLAAGQATRPRCQHPRLRHPVGHPVPCHQRCLAAHRRSPCPCLVAPRWLCRPPSWAIPRWRAP